MVFARQGVHNELQRPLLLALGYRRWSHAGHQRFSPWNSESVCRFCHHSSTSAIRLCCSSDSVSRASQRSLAARAAFTSLRWARHSTSADKVMPATNAMPQAKDFRISIIMFPLLGCRRRTNPHPLGTWRPAACSRRQGGYRAPWGIVRGRRANSLSACPFRLPLFFRGPWLEGDIVVFCRRTSPDLRCFLLGRRGTLSFIAVAPVSRSQEMHSFGGYQHLAALLAGLLVVPRLNRQPAFDKHVAALGEILPAGLSRSAPCGDVYPRRFFFLLAGFVRPLPVHSHR